jgi:hypothetical protein
MNWIILSPYKTIMISNQNPSSTPECHPTAHCHNYCPQEMPTPQHCCIPAQPCEDDNPFALVNGQPANDHPFMADVPVAGDT